MKDFFQSPKYRKFVYLLAGLLVALIVFGAGVLVGYRKGNSSFNWYRHYSEVLGGPNMPFMMAGGINDGDRDNAPVPHAAYGVVVAANNPIFMIHGPRQSERVVIVSPQTVIRKMSVLGTSTDIKVGDSLVIIGSPDDKGQIISTFIRIMPMVSSSTRPN